MQKSEPMPFSSATPTGGRKMAKKILMISLQDKPQLAECYTKHGASKAGPTRAVAVE